MSFDGPAFWLLFPFAWLLWRFLPFGLAKLAMLAFSLVFYAWWDVRYVPLIALSAVLDYYVGGRLAKTEDPRRRKGLVTLSIVFNLGLLGVFKYTPMAFSTAHFVAGTAPLAFQFADWVVPVGISFYTFQTLSYTIDIYRRRLAPAESFSDFFLYVAFFPQLVAGPIVRASQLLPQLDQRRIPSWPRIQLGLYRIVQGLFLKICIADSMAPSVNRMFEAANHDALSSAAAWSGAIFLGVQFYADFAGYSGIAIGLAMLFGLRFPENFNYPYISRGPSELWTRWHITLSSWLRDYLFIPLGGSRGGTAATIRNLIIVMFLGGLWHGAGWPYITWGLVSGLGLMVERLILVAIKKEKAVRVPRGGGQTSRALGAMLLTYVFVHFGYVFFRAADFGTALNILERMFVAPFRGDSGGRAAEWRYYALAAPVFFAHLVHLLHEWKYVRKAAWMRAVAFGLMLLGLLVLERGAAPAFVYFQF